MVVAVVVEVEAVVVTAPLLVGAQMALQEVTGAQQEVEAVEVVVPVVVEMEAARLPLGRLPDHLYLSQKHRRNPKHLHESHHQRQL